jgi:hypothetical protein
LHIGDYITLKYVSKGLESTEARSERYLYAEGIILGDLSVSSNLALFDDFVFCVHLQRQYSAAREYFEFSSVCDHSNYQDQRTLQALEVCRIFKGYLMLHPQLHPFFLDRSVVETKNEN